MNALVTGGTKGIGFAISNQLLEKGYNLAFCARNKEEVEDIALIWSKKYPKQMILGYQCDMKQKAEVEDFANNVLNQIPEINVLINNAGLFIPGEVTSEAEGVLEEMINVNLYSAYNLTRLIVPSMLERGSGHIFNMCSIASKIAYPNGGSYSISKFALLGFSKVLREELKPNGIKVTSILPGATWSNSWEGVDLPQERLMEANDIALAIMSALEMSPAAVVEEIILRPQLGDL